MATIGTERLLERVETSLPGVFEIRPQVFGDNRGFFMETYNRARLEELGIEDHFVQDNHSLSGKGTLRGLHYQLRRAQAKLCWVIEGEALDIVVDIRRGSPTFGKWEAVTLSAEQHNQIYIPRGFAHGFLALTERVQFLYKCSDFYDKSDEYGIFWGDPELKIEWGAVNPVISERDAKNPPLAQVPAEQLPTFGY
jgi:dTDP-4-dehydrorhamnose 3,5-epimerase